MNGAAHIAGLRVPAHLHPYVETLGVDRAVEFLLEFGGGTYYLAADPKGNSEVARWLGTDDGARLVARLRSAAAHPYLRIPVAKPWIATVMRSRGATIQAIARKLHATDTSVRGWLHKEDDRQMRLF